jgi:hypothetical protein
MQSTKLASEIAKRKLHYMRDGRTADAHQVYARAANYKGPRAEGRPHLPEGGARREPRAGIARSVWNLGHLGLFAPIDANMPWAQHHSEGSGGSYRWPRASAPGTWAALRSRRASCKASRTRGSSEVDEIRPRSRITRLDFSTG